MSTFLKCVKRPELSKLICAAAPAKDWKKKKDYGILILCRCNSLEGGLEAD